MFFLYFFCFLGVLRLDFFFMYGVDDMSIKDVFLYFESYGFGLVEWIDDFFCKFWLI